MKSTQRQFLITVEGLPDYYATQTGGEVTAETSQHYDGGTDVADVLAGPRQTSNLVCGRGYDALRDQPIIDRLEKLVGRWRTTVTKQPCDADWTPIGPPKPYPNSLLVRVTNPEADANSSSVSTYELEFATPGSA